MILFHDLETFSEVPINNGTYRYAEGAEIMLESWAVDDGPVHICDRTAGEPGPFDLFDPQDFEWIVYHGGNGPTFDRVVQDATGIHIPPEKVWDTAVQARSHGLPGGLDKLCEIFKLSDELKKKDGKKLIQLFCKPRPKNIKLRRATSASHPIEWSRFKEYAGGDIPPMRHLFKTLPRWNYPTREHGLWCLDQRINERGFQIDTDLADAAIAMMADEKRITDAQTKLATEGRLSSTTQRDKLLRELLMEHGVALPDMAGDTIERRLEDPDLPEPVKDLLRQRLLTSTTSTAKYAKVLKAMSSADQRMRGSLLFCGAPRTKRWSGKIFQPQNLPRPDMDNDQVEREIDWLVQGNLQHIMEPIRLSWNALRGLIVAAPGKKLVQADLAQIEARVLPWLAGEEWKLEAFRQYDLGLGPDLYYVGAARLLSIMQGHHVSPEEVTKAQRQGYGKVPDLACGYGGAEGAFAQFAALYRVDMSSDEVALAIRTWREGHPAIADWDLGLWKQLDDAARLAIQHPDTWFGAGEYIKFKRRGAWLLMRLPSGGFLSYAFPQIVPDPRPGRFKGNPTISFMGVDSYTRRWTRLYTYGGKLSADATQATARELLAHNMPLVEEKYPIILQVHDELLTEVPDSEDFTVDELVGLITTRPAWIDDKLPLAAGGFEAKRYRKDD